MTEATYPATPGHVPGSDTSRAAAESLDGAPAATLRGTVLQAIRRRNGYGATDDEIERLLDLRHQTASARRRELVLFGQVADSGIRRRTRSGRKAIVWVSAEHAPTRPENHVARADQ